MFVRMLKLPEAERRRHDVSSLRIAIHAAAPCPIPVKEQMIEWWGPVLYEYYAGTEGNGFTSINSADWLAHKGSVGRPLNAKLHILDDEGKELPPGEPGAIYFEGGPPFEYHNEPEKTAGSHTRGGLEHARRHRLRRRRGLPLSHRPQGQHDHLGRRQHLPAGGGERAGDASQGRRRRGLRRSRTRISARR